MEDGSGTTPLGQAGYAITGSGGGGSGGSFVFANLEEVDAIIAEAETLLQDVRDDGTALNRAAGLIRPPSENIMSKMEADATIESFAQAARHADALAAYVDAELVKLRACRDAYVNSDEESAGRLRNVGGG